MRRVMVRSPIAFVLWLVIARQIVDFLRGFSGNIVRLSSVVLLRRAVHIEGPSTLDTVCDICKEVRP